MRKYVLIFLLSTFASLSFAKGNSIKLRLHDFLAVDTMQLVVTYSREDGNGLSLKYWKDNNLSEITSQTIINRYHSLYSNKGQGPKLVYNTNSRYVINVKIERIDENDCECYGYLCITDMNTNTLLFECYFDVEGNRADGVKARLVKVMNYFGKKIYNDMNHFGTYFRKNYVELEPSKVDVLIKDMYNRNQRR